MTQSNQHATTQFMSETHIPTSRFAWIIPLSALLGLGCFILAQYHMLTSRNPLIPSALYLVGFFTLLPFLNHANGVINRVNTPINRANSTVDEPTLSWHTEAILVIGWMGIALLLYLPLPLPTITLPTLTENGPLWLFIAQYDAIFPPDPAYLQALSRVFAWLLIPAVYLFGRALDGRLTGFFAAGFATTGLWGLALSQGGTVFSTLATGSALFLAALYCAIQTTPQHEQRSVISLLIRFRWLIVLLILVTGVLFSPLFGYLELLLPIALALACLELRHRLGQIIGYALIAITLAVTLLPLLGDFPGLLPRPEIPELYIEKVGISSLITTADGLSSSLLLFNLTSDPNPIHGIVDRPAFAPIMAGAFIVGLLGWLWRLVDHRRPSDWLLLVALIVGMLPSALYIVPPLRYPHLGWAALSLPVGLVLAAWGLSRIAIQMKVRWGKGGELLAIGLYLLALVLIAQDTRQHYSKVFLPLQDQAPLTATQTTFSD